MLQMMKMANKAKNELDSTTPFPPPWDNMRELENAVNLWMERWLLRRSQIARKQSLYAEISDYFDRVIRTDVLEHTDNPEVSPLRKLKIVRNIHRMIKILGADRHYYKILIPLIQQIASSKKRPARLLELASGSSEIAMHLAAMAKSKALPVQVTASDYIEDVVEDAKKRAQGLGLEMTFQTINALNMGEAIKNERYDIFLIIGSMHHFAPGQLAAMIAQARLASEPGALFIGIDLYRVLPMLLFLPLSHLVVLSIDSIHDAWITARKAYSLYELEQIARIASPSANITAVHSFPGLSVLKVWF